MDKTVFIEQELGFYLEFPGHPQPKERPRYSNGHMYTPQKTRDAEKSIKDILAEKSLTQGKINMIGKDTAVSVVAHFAKDCTRLWVTNLGTILTNTPRADSDNYFKLLGDSIQGILIENDNQIVKLLVVKGPLVSNWYL